MRETPTQGYPYPRAANRLHLRSANRKATGWRGMPSAGVEMGMDILQPRHMPAAARADVAGGSAMALLRAVAVALGIGWSILFVVVGLHYDLQMYGDGSIFSYAVAARDAWAFHLHNMPGRLFVYLFSFA